MTIPEATEYIRQKGVDADGLASEYLDYVKAHPEGLPPTLPERIQQGKDVYEAYSYLQDKHEETQMQQDGTVDVTNPLPELATAPLLAAALLQKPKNMEDDSGYQKIEEKLKKEWLKNNPGKDLLSKEGLDYIYGSAEDRTKTSLRDEAEAAFRADPKNAQKIERYDREKDKIYKKSEDDPRVQLYRRHTQEEINARIELFEKKTKNSSTLKLSKEEIKQYQDRLVEQVHRKYLREFAEKHPEKTKTYHQQIKAERELANNRVSFGTIIRSFRTQDSSSNAYSQSSSQAGSSSPISNRSPNGIVKRGVNGLNRLLGKKNKIPLKGVLKPKPRGFLAWLTGPMGITILTLISIALFVFLIVSSGAAPSAPNQQPPTATQ